ncbi:acetyltransferase [Pseudomonas donghuensis]|uniref:acetyltransferase n=1 Tax=Pseudomonas donghuensis TaxID=1163398 RepID=UPI0020C4F69B|nr:acetyltransferase [Pseudomonas donghuensis]MCP6699715.1 acetyltransferase [Pseudomonas donghuensis]
MMPPEHPPSGAPFVILGAGGHAKVLLSLLQALGAQVKGVCDPGLAASSIPMWRGIVVLGGDEALEQFDPSHIALVNGMGQVVGSSRRRDIFVALTARGFRFPALVHPAAWVDASVILEAGVQVMAGAVIQPDATIGANTIINTGARVDHDCIIGSHVHVAPAAVLCGGVKVSPGAFIGAGSTTIQGLSIGEDGKVGAGTTLIRDLPAGHLVVGSPVRTLESKN